MSLKDYFNDKDINYMNKKLKESDLLYPVQELLKDYFIMLNEEYGLSKIARLEPFNTPGYLFINSYIKNLEDLSKDYKEQIAIVTFSLFYKYKKFILKDYMKQDGQYYGLSKEEYINLWKERKKSLEDIHVTKNKVLRDNMEEIYSKGYDHKTDFIIENEFDRETIKRFYLRNKDEDSFIIDEEDLLRNYHERLTTNNYQHIKKQGGFSSE